MLRRVAQRGGARQPGAATRAPRPRAPAPPRFRQRGDGGGAPDETAEHLRRVAELPEAPQTARYPPPADLDLGALRNPGSPRAWSAPDRFHADEDGAPRPDRLTVLQQHVAFFDTDGDGKIFPWDTAAGFRAIGYNPVVSALAPLFIHTGMSLPTQEGFPDPRLPIIVKNIHKCIHGSHSGVYDAQGRFIPQAFEEIFSKYDRDGKGGLSYPELLDMLSAQASLYDGFGRIAALLEWTVTYAGFKDENGVLPREAIRKQFNGELFHEYAKKLGASMKEKKGHDISARER